MLERLSLPSPHTACGANRYAVPSAPPRLGDLSALSDRARKQSPLQVLDDLDVSANSAVMAAPLSVMAGLRPGDPENWQCLQLLSWMAGSSPAKTLGPNSPNVFMAASGIAGTIKCKKTRLGREGKGAGTSKAIVAFGEDWGGHPSSTQHLMSCLAGDWTILWVNSLGLRRPRLNGRDFFRIVSKIRARLGASPAAAAEAPFPVAAPLVLPFPASATARRVNTQLLRRRIRPKLEAAGIERPILWASLPTAIAAAGQLDERAIVYYCGDDFGALPGVDHQAVLALEQELVGRAHLIIAASETLAARFPPEKTIHVPHGADLDLFSRPAPRAPELPSGRPVAGYYGSIADWVDLEAVAAAARELADWDFVFIGPVSTDVSPLANIANVKFLGPRPHAALPSYSQHWTVSLIPFRQTPQIEACNPLKLREYLASGRPVASAAYFPALEPYKHHIAIAAPASSFASAILRASRQSGEAEARRNAVAGESWAARAAIVNDALEQL